MSGLMFDWSLMSTSIWAGYLLLTELIKGWGTSCKGELGKN
jgi:hypothetical protein